MGNMHRCVICLGSNHHAKICLAKAEKMLGECFPSITWGKIVETAPEGTFGTTPYLNRAALIGTTWDIDRLTKCFKEMERACGRTKESRRTGIIPLDIDLLVSDGQAVKPADLQKRYVRRALEELPLNISFNMDGK